MGQKRKQWSPEEDKVLMDFITSHGHENWRALPEQTGLSRCGRSCRFRWFNYLRPDIKRGNFSIDEEEEIIKLHECLGNRWSAIAAKLPGRTDNEIKNVWNTRLKKKLKKNNTSPESSDSDEEKPVNTHTQLVAENSSYDTQSPPQSTSEFSYDTDTSSSMVTFDNEGISREDEYYASSHDIFHIDANFSTDFKVEENSNMLADFSPSTEMYSQQQTCYFPDSSDMYDDMDFWLELFLNPGEKLNVLGDFSPSAEIDTEKQHRFSPYRSNMDDDADFWLDLYLNAREQQVSENNSAAEERIDISQCKAVSKVNPASLQSGSMLRFRHLLDTNGGGGNSSF